MSDVGSGLVTGMVESTNALITIRTMNFKPRKVVLYNAANSYKMEFNDQMGDEGFVLDPAGGSSYLGGSPIIPLDPDTAGNPGFSIAAGVANFNDALGEELVWEAYE